MEQQSGTELGQVDADAETGLQTASHQVSPIPSPVVIAEDEQTQSAPDGSCPVVGIGASAGGLEALTQLLEQLPADTGMAFVLVQHLDPKHESLLADLLTSHTYMPVEQTTQNTRVEPDHVYVIPPNTQMGIEGGVLRLTPRADDRRAHLPIDFFLSSLAADQRSRSIGIILSGAASDGTIGLEAIKAAGGITFAQDSSAKFDSMPRNAVAAGVVDFVLAPDLIARELAVISDHAHFEWPSGELLIKDGLELHDILARLQARTGVNFAHYKMPTIHRRLSRRMALNHVRELGGYLKLLDQRPTELDALFNDLLITVTDFFRDPETFAVLAEKAFPAMLAARGPEEPIRVWVSGCASGKEVYSLAICLIEYLEKIGRTFPLQIFGTDLSERSIETARLGKYPETIASSVTPERLKRHFIKIEHGYQIARSVREVCIFSRQDVTGDPPLSRMDLVSCRNLLIYLGPTLQRRVLSVFARALQPDGFLLLGNSESLGASASQFTVLDAKHKIYKRDPQMPRAGYDPPARAALAPRGHAVATAKRGDATNLDLRADRLLLDEYAPSGFLVNSAQQVVKFRGEVGPYLAPPAGDPQLDVFQLVREDLAFPLRVALEQAASTDEIARHEKVRLRQGDQFREINIVVRPIADNPLDRHFLILFEEISQQPRLSVIPERAGRDSSSDGGDYTSLVDELTATRAYMQRLVEELRSANEEAQSSNEELQSTNEELQTAKEELQSSNEELTTTNEEMQGRNVELSEVNNDLLNLLSSMQVPIVMLTRDQRIRRYTPISEKVLNLIPTDVGRPISDLKPRINVPDLEALLERVSTTNEPLDREVQDREGRWFSLRIHPYRTAQNRVEGTVLQLLDVNQLKQSMNELQLARDYSEAIIETVREPLLVLDANLRIQTANRAFFETFGLSAEAITDKSIYEIDDGQWNLPKVSQLFERLATTEIPGVQDVEIERDFERLGIRIFQLCARKVYRSEQPGLILLAMEDISDRKRAAEAKYRRLFETAKDAIVIINGETGEITDVNPYLLELFGYKRGDLVGKTFWDAEPICELENARNAFDRLRHEDIVRFPDVPMKSKDGRHVAVEVVANMYREGSRPVAQFNIRDITERKHFDQQMQQTARLESLGILAGGIAHDFNNLLAGILGNAGLALADAPPDSPYQSALKDVVYASQRAADLTRQMLAYAGKGRFVVRRVDLSEVVEDISNLIRSSIPKSVELHLELGKGLPLTEADAGQMQQVVMNLIINGAEAVGEGTRGRVRVITRRETLTAEDIRANFPTTELRPGAYVVLEVIDNGSGMEERTREHIFDPFFTTKFTGRGLGLASVQGIVKSHGGAIHVQSTLGRGSTFRVLLPAVDEVRHAPPALAPPEDLRGNGELIVVVDDEDIVRRTTRTILERNGYRVLTSSNGQEGLDCVRQNKGEIRLIILDLTMPLMGGAEALAQIQQVAPGLPTVISSGYDTSRASSQFSEGEVAGFIQKPTPVPEFLKAVKNALRTSH